MATVPRLVLTPGEPAGIGPDLIIQLAKENIAAELIVIADKKMMQDRARLLGVDLNFYEYNPKNSFSSNTPVKSAQTRLSIYNIDCPAPVVAGQLNKNNSSYVLQTLSKAANGCLDNEFDAMVTAPLHKGIINDAGVAFTGHTEFLAELTKSNLPVMMLAANRLRVALATTHLPLKDVSTAITKSSLTEILRVLGQDLKSKFGLKSPHILICGLNPHAGEGGHLGLEEIEIIKPVIKELKKSGMNLTGPLPADTLFTPKYLENADAVLAMYHDQGLPVLKHTGFGHAVNITLGLPIIRTSVDHGTALDLAGTGKASIGSLLAAINTAIEMANSKNNNV